MIILSIIPKNMKLIIKKLPPELMKGKGSPVTGKRPIDIPMLIKTWTQNKVKTPNTKS